MNLDFNKVLVGVSGGVDSSVCVDLLKKRGLQVIGTVINFSPASAGAIADAKKVGEQLGIEVFVSDASDKFEKNVITPFCQSYIKGQTPNPCVVCNPTCKFATLFEEANRLGIGYVATGHYAQIEKSGETYYVKRALSLAKDQSYMLYRLPQEYLSRMILPIGRYEKPLVREMADDLGLFTAQKPDSQEICFIPDGNHTKYITDRGFKPKYGWLIAPDGSRIKRHEGVHNYTVGQRKGLGVALGKPAFVKEIRENGDVILGFAGREFSTFVTVKNPVYTKGVPFKKGEEYAVKIRSVGFGSPAVVEYADNEKIVFKFPDKVRAAARGQSAVAYKGDLVAGGGFIDKAED